MKYYIGQVDCQNPCPESMINLQAGYNGLPIDDSRHFTNSNNDAVNSPTDSSKTCTHTAKDPVHDVCPGLKVKIADLGNACWEVKK